MLYCIESLLAKTAVFAAAAALATPLLMITAFVIF